MRAIITGAKGQDGKLLRSSLEGRGYLVLGIDRPRPDLVNAHTGDFVRLDLTDEMAVKRVFHEFEPDEIYHLAACHHSSEQKGLQLEREMIRTNFQAVEVLVAVIQKFRPACRLFIAGSSQMYRAEGRGLTVIDESTSTTPSTFYGFTKAWSRELLAYHRRNNGLFGCMGILFNHESCLRPATFLSRKISIAAAHAKLGYSAKLQIRNIASEVDWSAAEDVVEGMRLALSASSPQDYVLASGRSHRVSEVLDIAFDYVGLNWRNYTEFEEPSDRRESALVGNAQKARIALGWQPYITFEKMIRQMVAYDLAQLKMENAAGR